MELLIPKYADLSKVLEIARILYPEYNKAVNDARSENGDAWGIEAHVTSGTYFICISQDDGCRRIHWYEFLDRWIRPKLYNGMHRKIDEIIKELIELSLEKFVKKNIY